MAGRGFTVFSFGGQFPIVYTDTPSVTKGTADGVGLHTFYGADRQHVGTIVDEEGRVAAKQDYNLDELKQLAKDEVMRLYEEQVYGVENKPTDLVITEWREKEYVALAWQSGQLPPSPHPLTDGYRIAQIASLTAIETAEFAAMTPPLIPGTDDDAICDILSERVIGAATAKRVLLHFAGGQRRDANDAIDATTSYLALASVVVFIQEQVPVRTAEFMASLTS
jgi:hypothetical protein